jgi:hypothetical protein
MSQLNAPYQKNYQKFIIPKILKAFSSRVKFAESFLI